MPRLSETPVATTVDTPRARNVASRLVPPKGDTPWRRCETRSLGLGPELGDELDGGGAFEEVLGSAQQRR